MRASSSWERPLQDHIIHHVRSRHVMLCVAPCRRQSRPYNGRMQALQSIFRRLSIRDEPLLRIAPDHLAACSSFLGNSMDVAGLRKRKRLSEPSIGSASVVHTRAQSGKAYAATATPPPEQVHSPMKVLSPSPSRGEARDSQYCTCRRSTRVHRPPASPNRTF